MTLDLDAIRKRCEMQREYGGDYPTGVADVVSLCAEVERLRGLEAVVREWQAAQKEWKGDAIRTGHPSIELMGRCLESSRALLAFPVEVL